MNADKVIACPNHGKLKEARQGVMLHFDGSVTDPAAWAWFLDKRCKVSYNWLVLDDGTVVQVAPPDRRAWHAGVCKPAGDVQYKDANSAFYGIAAATNEKTKATPAQVEAITNLCREIFDHHGWTEAWRIRGHDQECWPRGRKIDPTGNKAADPILSVADVREAV